MTRNLSFTSVRRGSLSLPSPQQKKKRRFPSPIAISISIPLHPFHLAIYFPFFCSPSTRPVLSSPRIPCLAPFLPSHCLSLSLFPVWLVHLPPSLFPSCHPRPTGFIAKHLDILFCRQGFDIASCSHLHPHHTQIRRLLSPLPTYILTRFFSSTWRDHCFFFSSPFPSFLGLSRVCLFSLSLSLYFVANLTARPYYSSSPPTDVCVYLRRL